MNIRTGMAITLLALTISGCATDNGQSVNPVIWARYQHCMEHKAHPGPQLAKLLKYYSYDKGYICHHVENLTSEEAAFIAKNGRFPNETVLTQTDPITHETTLQGKISNNGKYVTPTVTVFPTYSASGYTPVRLYGPEPRSYSPPLYPLGEPSIDSYPGLSNTHWPIVYWPRH